MFRIAGDGGFLILLRNVALSRSADNIFLKINDAALNVTRAAGFDQDRSLFG